MGHLINPISMRLGWFSNWNDVYYSENHNYAGYFHLVFRLRLYLVYFFSLKRVEKLGLFYSHFEILRRNISLIVNVFIYHVL